jgi:hypothetical protein
MRQYLPLIHIPEATYCPMKNTTMSIMDIRQALLLVSTIILVCSFTGCLNPPQLERKVIEDTGTLHLPDAFGSSLRIESDHGIIYTPEQFPHEGFKDGMKVLFTGTTSPNPYYPVQTAIPIHLVLLRPLPGSAGPVYGIGNVTHVDLEGGFYGITVDTGSSSGIIRYYPSNLDQEFQVDGITISFSGDEQPGMVTVQQWGTPLFITRVRQIT